MKPIKKLCNALIKDANPKFLTYCVGGAGAAIPMKLTLGIFKKVMGGLWVGGSVTLDNQMLIFKPNKINKLVHQEMSEIAIPLDSIMSATNRFGFVTGIVDIKTDSGVLSVRLYGAKKFAGKINSLLPQ